MHRMMPSPISRWLKAGEVADEGLARIGSGSLVTPPKGLEVGYVPIALYQGAKKHSDCVTPAPPGPTPPTPPPEPTPSPAPGPSPSVDGVTLYEKGGSGRLFLPKGSFVANTKSNRGGALAWDVCGGGSFDNGNPLWTQGVGSFVGSFQVTGSWGLRTSVKCGLHFSYDPLPMGSKTYTAADGVSTFDQEAYFEEA